MKYLAMAALSTTGYIYYDYSGDITMGTPEAVSTICYANYTANQCFIFSLQKWYELPAICTQQN